MATFIVDPFSRLLPVLPFATPKQKTYHCQDYHATNTAARNCANWCGRCPWARLLSNWWRRGWRRRTSWAWACKANDPVCQSQNVQWETE